MTDWAWSGAFVKSTIWWVCVNLQYLPHPTPKPPGKWEGNVQTAGTVVSLGSWTASRREIVKKILFMVQEDGGVGSGAGGALR